MKKYEAPKLTVQDYVADTMITSSNPPDFIPKNGNAANNHNCWACNTVFNQIIGENACLGSGTPGC